MVMISWQRLVCFGLLIAGLTLPSEAAEKGNADVGRQLVARSCSSCHATSGAATQSDAAPPLTFMARDQRQRPAWVRGWLMNPHPPMPGVMLTRQEIADVIAYLQTLPVERGDVAKGQMFAQMVCAECHAVSRGDRSRSHAGPSFASIAASPGLTATAIRVWLQSPHPTMPNLMLSPEDKDNVIAYLLSLKTG